MLLSTLSLSAQSTWSTAGSGTWSNAANWSGGVPNSVGALANFRTDIAGGNKTITLDSGVTVGSLYVSGLPAVSTTLTFAGQPLTFQNTSGSALLSVLDFHDIVFNNAITLGSNLSVSMVDDGSGEKSSIVFNGSVAGNGNNLAIDVQFQISHVTISGTLSGAGTQVNKTGLGILRLLGNNNTFSGGLNLSGGRTETTISNVAGATLNLGAVLANANNLGVGNISVSGVGTVLDIRTSAANQSVNLASGTLTITNGGTVNVFKNATTHSGGTFNVSGGTLDGGAGAAGTLWLNGLDFNFVSGAITNNPNLYFSSGTGATATTTQYLNGSGNLNNFGNITKDGLGNFTIGNNIATLVASNILFRSSGTLNFGTGASVTVGNLVLGVSGSGITQSVVFNKDNQLSGNIEIVSGTRDILNNPFYNIATLNFNGNSAAYIGSVRTGDLAALKLDMGANGASNTLTISGNNVGDVNIINWEGNPTSHLGDGNAAVFDKIILNGSVNPNDVWVYGFEKGVVADGIANEYKPVTFLSGTYLNFNANYLDYRNWNSGSNVAGMEIPNHPGAIANILGASAGVSLSGTITLGQLVSNNNNGIVGGTIIWDSGVTGSAAIIRNTTYMNLGDTWVLNSDLNYKPGLSIGGGFDRINHISGTGALLLNGGALYVAGGNPSFTGNTVLNNSVLALYDGSSGDRHFLGSGTLILNGGQIVGRSNGGSTLITTVTNPLVIGGNFTAAYITFGYGGDVTLTGTKTITVSEGSASAEAQSVAFSATTNLVGTGALVKAGDYRLNLSSPNNTFSGGLTVNLGRIYTTVGADGLVIGALAAGQNYLGSGTVTTNNASSIIYVTNAYLAEVRGLLSLNTASYGINFMTTGTTLLQSTGTIRGPGRLEINAGQTLTNNGITLLNLPGIHIGSGGGVINGTPITGVGTLSKNSLGTGYVNTQVSGQTLNPQAGTLLLNVSGNSFNTVTFSGGILRTGTSTNNSLGTLNLTGNAGIYMETDSVLTFSGFSGTNASQWTSALQLNLANDDGVWNTASQQGVTNNYIYITNTANTTQLNNIAFTGYAPGAVFLNNSGSYYLAPTGVQIHEWIGDPSASFSGSTWSAGDDWLNGVPNASGVYAAIRDYDEKLDGKTILVDGLFAVGTLEISNASATFTLGSSGTLRFSDPSGTAKLNITNGNRPTFTSAWQLDSDLNFSGLNNGGIWLYSKISGAGGITYTGVNSRDYALYFGGSGSASDFSGGFRWIGSVATAANASNSQTIAVSGSGSFFGTGTLSIGDGTAGRWYTLKPEANSVSRVVTLGGLELKANLFYGSNSRDVSSTLTLNSTTGVGTITSGTWTLSGNGANGSGVIAGASTLILGMNLQGGGALLLAPYSRVDFLGDNRAWSGGLVASDFMSNFGVGTDTALGTGTVNIRNQSYIYALNGSRTLDNVFAFTNNGGADFYGGSFVLNGGIKWTSNGGWIRIGTGNTVTLANDDGLTGNSTMKLGYNNAGNEGTLVILGSNSFTGIVSMEGGRLNLAVGNDRALGTGTLMLNFNGSEIGALLSVGGSVTLGNALTMGTYAKLDGSAGLLTLNPTVAQTLGMTADKSVSVMGGTAAFGQNLSFSGAGGIIKTGSGTLWMSSASSSYTGNTQIAHGTLSANAGAGNITLGKIVAGENYFGQGVVSFVSGNYVRTLELISSGSVTLGGNLLINGNSAVNTANINITEQSGTVSGNSVVTYLNPDSSMVISGNEFGYLRTPGDLVKNGSGLVSMIGGNLTPGGNFNITSGSFTWNGGTISTSNLNVSGGALTLGSVNNSAVGTLTLGDVTLNVSNGAAAMLTNTTLDVQGDATVNFLGSTGAVTFGGGAAGAWSGALTVTNWSGYLAGGGNTRLQVAVNNVTVSDLNETLFLDANPSVQYVKGARVVKNYLGYYELVPLGSGAEWSGSNGNDLWDTITPDNWEPTSTPNAVGSIAKFANLDPALNGKTVTMTNNQTIGGLVLQGTAANYTITSPAYSLFFQQTPGAGAAYIQVADANSVRLDTLVALTSSVDITHLGSGTLFFDKTVSGNGGITKSGSGVVVFSTANSFLGGFTLNDGEVIIGDNGSLGAGLLAFEGGTLNSGGAARNIVNNYSVGGTTAFVGSTTLAGAGNATGTGGFVTNDTLSLTGNISGNGSLSMNGTGTLSISGSNSFRGGFSANEGVTSVSNSAAFGTGTLTLGLQSGTPATTGTVQLNGSGLNINNNVIADGGIVDTLTNSATLSGTIAGTNGFGKIGTGTLTLTSSNAYTGTTNVSAGAVNLTNADALGQSQASLSSQSSLNLLFNNGTFDNSVSGAGAVNVNGTSIRIDNADNSAYTGTWNVNGSGLINDANDLGANSKVNISGTLTADGAANIVFNNALSGSGNLNFTTTGTHGFGSAVGSAFTGTVSTSAGEFDWDTNASNALTNATLNVSGGLYDVFTGSQSANALALSGGTGRFTGTAFTNTLSISNSSAVIFDPTVMNSAPLLQQDEGGNNTYIVYNSLNGSLNNLYLVTEDGTRIYNTSTVAVGSGTEAYGIYSSTFADTGSTVGVNYQLEQLILQTSKTLTLNGDVASPNGGAELHALISGSGNLEIRATNGITLNNVEQYTGTTFITSGTLISGTTNVIASSTAVVNNSVFALNNFDQLLNNLSGSGTTLTGTNALTVNQSANTTYTGVITGSGAITTTGNNVTIDSDKYRPNTDGPRAEFGTGLIWQLDANNQLHLDYEASFGESYNSPWGVNFGYRDQF